MLLVIAGVAGCDDVAGQPPMPNDGSVADTVKGPDGEPSDANVDHNVVPDARDGSTCPCPPMDAPGSEAEDAAVVDADATSDVDATSDADTMSDADAPRDRALPDDDADAREEDATSDADAGGSLDGDGSACTCAPPDGS